MMQHTAMVGSPTAGSNAADVLPVEVNAHARQLMEDRDERLPMQGLFGCSVSDLESARHSRYQLPDKPFEPVVEWRRKLSTTPTHSNRLHRMNVN